MPFIDILLIWHTYYRPMLIHRNAHICSSWTFCLLFLGLPCYIRYDILFLEMTPSPYVPALNICTYLSQLCMSCMNYEYSMSVLVAAFRVGRPRDVVVLMFSFGVSCSYLLSLRRLLASRSVLHDNGEKCNATAPEWRAMMWWRLVF